MYDKIHYKLKKKKNKEKKKKFPDSWYLTQLSQPHTTTDC